MKKIFAALFSLLMGTILNAQQTYPIADSNNVFAFKLYDEVKNDTAKGNCFFSPFSISTALAMTYAGARGETEKQMCNTLHFSLSPNPINGAKGIAFHKEYKTYLDKIESDTGKDLVMGIANSLWLGNSLHLLPAFSEIVKSDYHAEAKNVDFANSEQARQEINSWVEDKTHDKIKDLIKQHVLGPDTRLVLVNAIYFKGKWKIPFSKDSTKTDDFYKNTSSVIKANFMHNAKHYRYYDDDLLQAIEIPYAGDTTSMVILLPQERDGINSMETKLDYAYYSKITSSLRSEKVILALPKFKTTVEFELSKTLSKMGMPDAFGAADFSGISNESLYISHVIHKAFIDVNEEGTEAAAATAVVMTMLASIHPRPIPVFIANHPFIFVIRDNATGSILFMGKITDPTKE